MNSDEQKNIFDSINVKVDELDSFIKEQINQRLRTVEWVVNNNQYKLDYLLDCVDFLTREARIDKPEVQAFLDGYPDYSLVCSRNIAVDSNDHIEPESTFEGNVSRPEFVYACERVLAKNKLKFLDIGCGSGALVFDFICKGHFAVGIDGSDACGILGKGYWEKIKHLHNCDVTRDFTFIDKSEQRISFDIISMWEVFEHILY